MNTASKHLTYDQLADLAEGRLNAVERQTSLAHTHDCSRCGEQLIQLEQLINTMRADAAIDPPNYVVARALDLFPTRVAAAGEPSLVRRVLAALSFDSLQLPAAYGVRSGQSATRQLLYNAGENDLDLRVTASGESWVLSGQVLGDCTGGEVELEGEAGAARSSMNELCEFTLPAVPTGSYTLRLRLNEMEVEVPQLELRA
jgi:anti-sigma factor RsiW